MAAEAHADGLLSPSELRDTVAELRGTYAAQLAALGVDAAALPDPADDSDDGGANAEGLLYEDASSGEDDDDGGYGDAARGGARRQVRARERGRGRVCKRV